MLGFKVRGRFKVKGSMLGFKVRARVRDRVQGSRFRVRLEMGLGLTSF